MNAINHHQHQAGPRCAILGCGRPVAAPKHRPVQQFHCVYHVQRKARHGSHWHPGYRAADLKPYVKCAESWLKANAGHPLAFAAWQELNVKLAMAGPVDPAMNLRGRSPAYRAQVAFARLREANINPDRLIAICLATAALIEDDRGSHRVREFRIVQAAKAVHRLASGTHRSWNIETRDGRMVPYTLHAYPRSSGLVMRRLGEALEKACEGLASVAIPAIIAARRHRYGPHPSHLPGWRQAPMKLPTRRVGE
ncbi:hypothetical protein [Kumtagia ephedrae]|nr:hypothetical protein [Mesorhizobium ephedrae]